VRRGAACPPGAWIKQEIIADIDQRIATALAEERPMVPRAIAGETSRALISKARTRCMIARSSWHSEKALQELKQVVAPTAGRRSTCWSCHYEGTEAVRSSERDEHDCHERRRANSRQRYKGKKQPLAALHDTHSQ
jgi:hypothetical protein